MVDKKWLFELLEVHFPQPKGTILPDNRNKIMDLDTATPAELGKGYGTPELFMGLLLEKNDFLMEAEQGLTGVGLIRGLRTGNIMGAYQFEGGL